MNHTARSCIFLAIACAAWGKSPDFIPQGLTVVEWRQIRAEYERHRHAAYPEAAGFQARSFEQQWLAHFDGRGLSVVADDASWIWGLELEGVSGRAHVTTDINRVTYRWSDGLDEWFLNDTRGLEHGFTLNAPGANAGNVPRELILAVRGGLQPRMADGGIEFADQDGTARITYGALAARDSQGRALPARMNVRRGHIVLAVDDRGAHYPITVDPIVQQAYLKASYPGEDQFGGSVAVSGNTVIVGAPTESSNATGVNGNPANNTKSNSGAAYVFVNNGVNWSQQAYLKASNTRTNDTFGLSVTVSGDTVVIGAPQDLSGGPGAAYVFARSGTTWTQQMLLSPSNMNAHDDFGISVSLSADTLAVGAVGETGTYVFLRSGTVWAQQALLTGAIPAFGQSVAVSGDTLIVGAPGGKTTDVGTAAGFAFVYTRSAAVWTLQASLQASNASGGDFFGHSVSLAGDTAVVGAQGEGNNATGVNGNQNNGSAPKSGAAYVFFRNGTNWAQQAYLKASNTNTNDFFGWSVSVSGDTIAAGAYGESSSATGVNGNQSDNSKGFSGAAYLFTRTGSIWSQQAYLKASNTDTVDLFGSAVAVSSSTVVIGALSEASSATGVNGNQSDNSLPSSGAAYVFTNPTVTVTVTSSPVGLTFTTSGTGCAAGPVYTTPQTLTWSQGSPCTLSFTTPQTVSGSRYGFDQWEDASTNPTRVIAFPADGDTYTATFDVQYPLSVTVSPSGLGSVTAAGLNCSASCTVYYNSGTVVLLTPTPASNDMFTQWAGGGCDGGTGQCEVVMSSAQSLTAQFAPLGNTTVMGGISAKVGPQNARQWTVTFTNNGPAFANNITLNGFSLTQTSGAACTPVVLTPMPLLIGSIFTAGGTANGFVNIDFTGCAPAARFKLTMPYNFDFGLVTNTITISNQFQ